MKEDTSRLLIAVALSFFIVFAWNYMFPNKLEQRIISAPNQVVVLEQTKAPIPSLSAAPRVAISNAKLSGSISTQGIRFDDLKLIEHSESLQESSPPLRLLSQEDYFLDLSFSSEDGKAPGIDAIWQAEGRNLTSEKSVNFSWADKLGLKFNVKISVDKDYLFLLESTIENRSKVKRSVSELLRICRGKKSFEDASPYSSILAVSEGSLNEYSLKDVESKGAIESSSNSWIGISDRYWLSAVIPEGPSRARFEQIKSAKDSYIQAKASSGRMELAPGASCKCSYKLFVGAKQLKLLEHYKSSVGIPLFERAVNFGNLYFLARPIFSVLEFFYRILGNFGLGIILLTLCLRVALFGLTYRSDLMLSKLKTLQPKLQRIKEIYKDDPERVRSETIDLYRKERVSPIGCLPMLAQIPIMYAVYKVLDVAIELRHAKFALWIKDLSAKDPTNLFDAFGLLPWSPPSFLHVGAWPAFFALSMYIQQKLSPKPEDPVQASMLSFLPLVLAFVFASMPVGLVLYWTFSNIFGIVQQAITKRMIPARS